jgi:hypothetical protein
MWKTSLNFVTFRDGQKEKLLLSDTECQVSRNGIKLTYAFLRLITKKNKHVFINKIRLTDYLVRFSSQKMFIKNIILCELY